MIANLQSMTQFLPPEEKVELETHLGEDYRRQQQLISRLKKN